MGKAAALLGALVLALAGCASHQKRSAATKRSKPALLTQEWDPLEPGVIDHKLYVRGVGTVKEETVKEDASGPSS
ncbi:MAG TPA: hypothetical protein VK488_12540 [Gaiellaceae bacterium]|nr:hypothetical protein [Gaiellaceae bacterium]